MNHPCSIVVSCSQALPPALERTGSRRGGLLSFRHNAHLDSIYLPSGLTACSKKVLFHAWDHQQMGQKINHDMAVVPPDVYSPPFRTDPLGGVQCFYMYSRRR